jgi:hypothetical protein
MRSLRVLILALALPGPAFAGGYGSVYLVPALAECPGPASCARTFESAYTFDAIVLHSRASKYLDDKKPSFLIDLRGVRDPSGALVNGTVRERHGDGPDPVGPRERAGHRDVPGQLAADARRALSDSAQERRGEAVPVQVAGRPERHDHERRRRRDPRPRGEAARGDRVAGEALITLR